MQKKKIWKNIRRSRCNNQPWRGEAVYQLWNMSSGCRHLREIFCTKTWETSWHFSLDNGGRLGQFVNLSINDFVDASTETLPGRNEELLHLHINNYVNYIGDIQLFSESINDLGDMISMEVVRVRLNELIFFAIVIGKCRISYKLRYIRKTSQWQLSLKVLTRSCYVLAFLR